MWLLPCKPARIPGDGQDGADKRLPGFRDAGASTMMSASGQAATLRRSVDLSAPTAKLCVGTWARQRNPPPEMDALRAFVDRVGGDHSEAAHEKRTKTRCA